VFRRRPLPASKAEAIALMTENPKLVRRPVVIAGRRVVFGFDKVRLTELVAAAG
jgi:arsenate reductase-like glutaredoxin family protein|tara:strand:- start:6378 stop:6539 length:162 start_codon:yes stop_codon:yes gene_type:complete